MKWDIRCQNCGQFIAESELISGGASQMFVPDSAMTREEVAHHCSECTSKCGSPKSIQLDVLR